MTLPTRSSPASIRVRNLVDRFEQMSTSGSTPIVNQTGHLQHRRVTTTPQIPARPLTVSSPISTSLADRATLASPTSLNIVMPLKVKVWDATESDLATGQHQQHRAFALFTRAEVVATQGQLTLETGLEVRTSQN